MRLLGTGPSQVPTNADLGSMAFQNKESVAVDQIAIKQPSPIYPTDTGGAARSYGIVSTQLSIVPTTNLTAYTSITGGALAASTTYYFKIVAVDGLGGTTTASTEVSSATTSATTCSINVSWTPVTGAVSYQVWYGTATNTQTKYYASTGTTFTLTADSGTSATIPAINTTGNASFGGNVLSSGVGGVGYATGAGGTVTQGSGSGKATAVTLNKPTGQIVMNNASLAAATIVSFTFTNSSIATTDMVIVQHAGTGTLGGYTCTAVPGNGSATVYVRNNTAGALGEAIILQFAIIKSVTA